MTIERHSSTVCEVFDLDADPDESNDLLGTLEGDRIVADLTEHLENIDKPEPGRNGSSR
jgi:hypothetical protein